MQIRGLPRREAERTAFDFILIEFPNRAQPDADPNRCASCGKSERPDATLLPFGVGVRHTWLHSDCWEAWRAAQDRGDRSTRSDRDRRACEGNEMTGQKVPMSARWKRRRAPKPPGARAAGPTNSHADEARTRVEKTRIARGVTAQIVSWPPDNCFYCRRPIVFGARWVELVNDNERARFHSDCAPAWKLQQKAAGRRALGLKPEPALTEEMP
jgi:hypothetical protein